MKDMFKRAKGAAGELVSSTANKLTESAAKYAPERGDIKGVADYLVDTASKTATELSRLGKDALKTDLAKDAAAGAAIGAVVAVPIPIVGPIAGAVVGAGLGVYKNLRQTGHAAPGDPSKSQLPTHVVDVQAVAVPSAENKFAELEKLHELKVKGVLTEEEFTAEKKKVLGS
jgi:hypothetical protein